jgi:predicted TIM-barrel enzyme
MGVCPELQGLGVSSDSSTYLHGTPGTSTSTAAGYLDLGLSVVTTAANVGVSTVNAMMGSETTGSLGGTSAMKLQW